MLFFAVPVSEKDFWLIFLLLLFFGFVVVSVCISQGRSCHVSVYLIGSSHKSFRIPE